MTRWRRRLGRHHPGRQRLRPWPLGHQWRLRFQPRRRRVQSGRPAGHDAGWQCRAARREQRLRRRQPQCRAELRLLGQPAGVHRRAVRPASQSLRPRLTCGASWSVRTVAVSFRGGRHDPHHRPGACHACSHGGAACDGAGERRAAGAQQFPRSGATLGQIEANRSCPLSSTSVTFGVNRALGAGSLASQQLGTAAGSRSGGCRPPVSTQVAGGVNLALGRGAGRSVGCGAGAVRGAGRHELHPWGEPEHGCRVGGHRRSTQIEEPYFLLSRLTLRLGLVR